MGGRLGRYKDIAWFVAKYGRADFVTKPLNAGEAASSDPAAAEAFAKDLESLGPTFIKLGQILSTRADLLPPAYLDALARLQDDVEPFPYEDVERTIREELGVRVSNAFARVRCGADRRRLARPGSPRRAARRPRGGGQGAAAGRPRAGRQRPRALARDRRGLRSRRRASRNVDAARRPRGIPAHAAVRARLPRGGAQPGHHRASAPRLRAHRHPAAGGRLHHGARAHDGLRRWNQDHGGQPRRMDGGATARRSPKNCSAPTCSRSWSTACSTPIRTRATSC